MVDRDVRRPRRVRHLTLPHPVATPLPPPAPSARGDREQTGGPGTPGSPGTGPAAPGEMFTPNVAPPLSSASAPAMAPVRETVPPSPPAQNPQPGLPPLGRMRVPERPTGFPTAARLADADAEAAELRHDLDELKRRLDGRLAPPPPARRRNRKPLLGALVVGGTLAVLGTAILVPWSNLDLPGGSDGQAASTAQPAGGVAGVPVPKGAVALAPLAAPERSLPASGPGISEPGTMIVVQVGPDDTLDVVEQAILGPRGMRELNLALPSTATLGGEVADLTPSIRNLRVAVNGTAVTPVPSAGGAGWTVSANDQRARTVLINYQIDRAVMRSSQSTSGRALAVVLPLLAQSLREQGLPLVIRTESSATAQVGGATCPSASSAQSLCGIEIGNGWIATVPASATSPVLLLQLNLKD